MFQKLLKKWIDECKAKKMPELSRLQMFALVDFVNWLDAQRRRTTREAASRMDEADLICAKCGLPITDHLDTQGRLSFPLHP